MEVENSTKVNGEMLMSIIVLLEIFRSDKFSFPNI